MKMARLGIALLALVGVAATGLGAQEPQAASYSKLVSEGVVTLELEPQWQDTALMVVVRAETREGDLKSISLQDQVMLMVNLKCYPPDAASSFTGRKGLAWMLFRLPERPTSFAISIRDVGDESMRILRWPEPAATP